MMDFITAPQNLAFTGALGLLLFLALLEMVTLVIGAGVFNMIDNIMPDFDLDVDADIDLDVDIDADIDADLDVDADTDIDVGQPGLLLQGLSWLRIGKVPFLVFVALFLMFFGMAGYIVQNGALLSTGSFLHPAIAIIGALIFTLPGVRLTAGVIGRIFPKDATSAIPVSSLAGRTAQITLGTARKGSPAQAKLTDEFGTTHYIMVEPREAEAAYTQGSQVRLIRRNKTTWQGEQV